jgi:hypothetical protein
MTYTFPADIAKLEQSIALLKLHLGGLSEEQKNRLWYETQQLERGITFAISRRIA